MKWQVQQTQVWQGPKAVNLQDDHASTLYVPLRVFLLRFLPAFWRSALTNLQENKIKDGWDFQDL